MSTQNQGSHTFGQAWSHNSTKVNQSPFRNNLTRRNLNILQHMPMRSISTSLASANIKALRLFRNICRMIPFIINVHEVNHRFSPLQAKIYIANRFRQNSKMTNLTAIDKMIQEGYQNAHEAEWHFNNTGYMYNYILGSNKELRDHGISRLEQNRGAGNKKEAPTGFLRSFYQQKPEDRKERFYQ